MEVYISSTTVLNDVKNKINTNQFSEGDIILFNHSDLGSTYNLSGTILSNVIPFEVVGIKQAEFSNPANSSKNNITLMSKNILRPAVFDFDINENNELGLGSNNWEESKLRQYLNSSSGTVFENVPQSFLDLSDNTSYLYTNESGFLAGFDSYVTGCFPEVNIKTAKNDFDSGFSIGDKQYLAELNFKKSSYEYQKEYNDGLLSVYRSKTSRDCLTGCINDEINKINTKINECNTCINAINSTKTFLTKCKSDLKNAENDITNRLTNLFTELVNNFKNIENFKNSTSTYDYNKLSNNISKIFELINTITSEILSIEEKLNDVLKSFKDEDFLNYAFSSNVLTQHVLSIVPNIKSNINVDPFNFSTYKNNNLKNIKDTFKVNIFKNIEPLLNDLFFVIYDVCQKFNNDEYYFSNGKADGFRTKIIQFITFFESIDSFETLLTKPNFVFEKFKAETSFDSYNDDSFIKTAMFHLFHALNNIHYWKSSKKYCHAFCWYYGKEELSYSSDQDLLDSWRVYSFTSYLNFKLFDYFSILSTEITKIYREYYNLAFIYWNWYHSYYWSSIKNYTGYYYNFSKFYSNLPVSFYSFYYRYYLNKSKKWIDKNDRIRILYRYINGKREEYLYKSSLIKNSEVFESFVNILKKLNTTYHELAYDQKIGVIISEIIKDEKFKEKYGFKADIEGISNEFNKIITKITSYETNGNAYKLLAIFLKEKNMWSVKTLFDELKNFNENEYSSTIDFIENFKTSIGHISKLCITYLNMLEIYNENIKKENYLKNEFPLLIKKLIDSFNETKNYKQSLSILFKNKYETYENVSNNEMMNTFMNLIMSSINDFYNHVKEDLLVQQNKVTGFNFYINNDKLFIDHKCIENVTKSFYDLVDERCSQLTKMSSLLNENIEKLNKEISFLDSKIKKFETLKSYNTSNNISSSNLRLSANFFINELYYKILMSKIDYSCSIKKIKYDSSGNSTITNVSNYVSSYLTDEYNSMIKSSTLTSFNNSKNFNLYYFPPEIDTYKSINIPVRIENTRSLNIPSSTYINIEFPISGRLLDIEQIDYPSYVNVTDTGISNENSEYCNNVQVNVINATNLVEHYEYYNNYLNEQINYYDYLITDYKNKNTNKLNDTLITKDKVFIPSITELGFGDNNERIEGIEFNLNKSNSSIKKSNLNCTYLTRSPNTKNKFELYEINDYGSLDFTSTTYHKNGLVVCLNLYVP